MSVVVAFDKIRERTRSWVSSIPSGVFIALLSLALVSLVEPQITGYWKLYTLEAVLHVWRTLVALAAVGLWLLIGKRDAFSLFMILVVGCVFLSTWMEAGSMARWRVYYLPICIAVLIANCFGRDRFRELILSLFIVSGVVLAANFLSMIVFPEGFGDRAQFEYVLYFYGYRTAFFEFMLPVSTCAFLIDKSRGGRFPFLSVLVFILCVYQLIHAPSVTSQIAYILLIAFSLLSLSKRLRGVLNGYFYLAVFILVFLGVVVLRLSDYAGAFIGEVLHKSITFSGRTVVWDSVFSAMRDPSHVALGYGASGYQVLGGSIKHAHDTVLQILLNGGAIAAAAFLAMVFLASRNLFRYRKNSVAGLLAASIGAFLVASVFEVNLAGPFYFVLALSYYGSFDMDRRLLRHNSGD